MNNNINYKAENGKNFDKTIDITPSPAYLNCHSTYIKDKEKTVELDSMECKSGVLVYRILNDTKKCLQCAYFTCNHFGTFCVNPKVQERTGSQKIEFPQFSDDILCDKQSYRIIEEYIPESWLSYFKNDIGKTIFTSLEEAEQILSNM